jgi:thiamine-monophosphate kinase
VTREQQITEILTRPTLQAPKSFGTGDDAAVLSNGCVVAMDSMVEGVHFNHLLSPGDVGWKLVAVNASDIAAMGRAAQWATLSISLPDSTDDIWIQDFGKGLHEALRKWNIKLVGGDTTRSDGAIFLSMAMGSGRGGPPVWRSTAQPGDAIWVTGYLGEAAAGFMHPEMEYALSWLRRPEPPLRFGAALGKSGLASGMIDLSDGLQADLRRVCEASGTGAIIDPKALPKGPNVCELEEPLPYQTSFGEDYELLFTAPKEREPLLRQLAIRHRVKLTKIGVMTRPPREGHGMQLTGCEWPAPLFSHFSS